MAKAKKEQDTDTNEKPDIFDSIDKVINKRFGAGTVIDMDSRPTGFDCVSSENLSLDWILGGGWPKGKIVEIYGLNGVGKTTMVIDTAIKFQKADPRHVIIIDAENKINTEYAKELGLDVSKDRFRLSQENKIENLAEILEAYMEAGVSAIFIDSLSALVTSREYNGELDEKTGGFKEDSGYKAKVINQFWRKIAPLANKHNTFIMVTNHINFKIGGYGDPRYTPGGESTRNRALIRLELTRKDMIGEKGSEVGHHLQLYCPKNQASTPHKKQDVYLVWGVGFDNDKSLIDMAIFADVIKLGASGWMTLPNGKKVQGMEQCKGAITSDAELYKQIDTETRAFLGIKG